MRMSNEVKNIFGALNKIIAEVKDVSKTEQGFGYKYASLDNILKMLRPILAKNGCALIQSEEIDKETGFLVVRTLLTHISGEWIETTSEAPITELKGMNTYQSIGAGITYLRRYNISNMFAISSEEDTDATQKQVQTQKQNTKQVQVNNQADVNNQVDNPLKALGIEEKVQENGIIYLTEKNKGAIYQNKALIKELGYKWDANNKCWYKKLKGGVK